MSLTAIHASAAHGIHGAYLDALLDELASRDFAPERLLPRGRPAVVTPEALAELCRQAMALTEDPALALRYGLRINLASHGILGYALMSCRNGEQLLSLLVRYARLSVPHIRLERMLQGERLLLTCRPAGTLWSRTFFVELVLATLVAAARNLFQRPVPGAEAWFDYPPPPHAAQFARLGVPVRFDRPHSALVCRRRFLDMELGSANPGLAEFCARQCESLLATMRRHGGIAAEVRKLLLNNAGAFPDVRQMAQRLSLSERTLRRRLDAEGTSYRAVTDEVRHALADQYLTSTDLPVSDVAALLGYDDAANFRRAFRRWTGKTPAAHRKGNISARGR